MIFPRCAGLVLTLMCFPWGTLFAQKPAPEIRGDNLDLLRVGQSADGRMVVATGQVLSPAGKQVTFAGRPTDVALSPDGQFLAVLTHREVLLIDPDAAKILGRVPHHNGSCAGIAFTPDGKQILASSGTHGISVISLSSGNERPAPGKIDLTPPDPADLPTEPLENNAPKRPKHGPRSRPPGNPLPIGITVLPTGQRAWVVLNMRNVLAEIDLKTQKLLREIPVGNAPYGIAIVGDKAYVSNWAGRMPGPGDPQGPSGEAKPVRVDPVRNIASDGSVSVVDLAAGRELKQIVVGLHPSGIAASPDGKHVCVANANSDTVSVIDTTRDEVVETISVRPAENLLFGSGPSAVVFSQYGKTLYVSNGSNNAIAVVEFAPPTAPERSGGSKLLGAIPTGWYPAGLVLDPKRNSLYVANVKGIGSRNTDWRGRRKIKGKDVFGFNSHDYQGSVSLIPLPDAATLKDQTAAVLTNNRLTQQHSALAPPRPEAPPRPVPQRHGEPSLFEHVIYIIKENRTYDQVFGDIERGEGDPELCIYGQNVTPNHHKLVDEFVLLDNFYCNGSLSADGHQWATQSYTTDYIEKSFGGWPRSYPFDGGDAMAYAASGFLWDNALAHKKTLRVYGEFVKATIAWKDPARSGRPTFMECWRDYQDGTGLISIQGTPIIKTLEPYVCPTAIGFPGIVSDQYRASEFIRELEEFEKTGNLPNLSIMLLPNDHTSGTNPGMPTPAAAVADNDLALGRIVEAVSRSKFWPRTCIFVVQDDPQDGFDHIDGRRTVAMAISPYSRRGGKLVSVNYNQSSMIRTMELMLRLPPMNQFDASATPMAECFAEKPDLTPYTAAKNNIPLDQLNPRVADIKDPRQRHWAEESLKLPLDDIDGAEEGQFNRILWHAAKGRDDTYPAWAVLSEEEE